MGEGKRETGLIDMAFFGPNIDVWVEEGEGRK